MGKKFLLSIFSMHSVPSNNPYAYNPNFLNYPIFSNLFLPPSNFHLNFLPIFRTISTNHPICIKIILNYYSNPFSQYKIIRINFVTQFRSNSIEKDVSWWRNVHDIDDIIIIINVMLTLNRNRSNACFFSNEYVCCWGETLPR